MRDMSRRQALAAILGSVTGGTVVQTTLGRSALAQAAGVSAATDGPQSPPAFPIRIHPGGRYLEDSTGKPFLIQGDAGWDVAVQLKRAHVDRYLNDRSARGFNTIIVKLLEHKYTTNAPANINGEKPFFTFDWTTPNPKYFRHVDWVLKRAAEKGFLVLLAPAYIGSETGDGWYNDMVANGLGNLRAYGRYVGHRYRNFTNILWVHAGDRNPANKDVVRAVAEGIREFDTRSLNTAHCGRDTAALDYWSGEPWLQINSVYTYDPVYAAALAQYTRPEKMPFILIETQYENEYSTSEQRLRTQAYHALLSGACGQVFGNNPIWHFDGPGFFPAPPPPPTWQQALAGRGSISMTHLRTLFDGIPWWRLRPDTSTTFLTSGQGTGQDRAVGARTNNGSHGIVYVPGVRNITVNLSRLRGPNVTARWYDPSSGTFSSISGSPFPAAGSQVFNPGSNNAFGFDDWVLVLKSSP
jgi:hypothetical protein